MNNTINIKNELKQKLIELFINLTGQMLNQELIEYGLTMDTAEFTYNKDGTIECRYQDQVILKYKPAIIHVDDNKTHKYVLEVFDV